jgi:hypothetical protein
MSWERAAQITQDLTNVPKEGSYFDSSKRYQSTNTMAQEVQNSFANWSLIRKEYDEGKAFDADHDQGKGPALIFGSGPSFDDYMPRIKEWKGAVFCGTSQATTLAHYGRPADYVCAFDIASYIEELEGIDWASTDSKLVLHPGLKPDLVAWWKGQKRYFRNMDLNVAWYTDQLASGYDFIGTSFMTFATTLATELSAAHLMGYSPLILAGCDLGYPAGKPRFSRWAPSLPQDVDETKYFDPSIMVMSDNGILTDRPFLFYKRAIYCVWRLDESVMINASRGILSDMPSANVDDVFAGNIPTMNKAEIRDASERYLAKCNTYVIPMGSGYRLIECQDWRKEIPSYMGRIISMGFRGIDIDKIMEHVAELHGEAA